MRRNLVLTLALIAGLGATPAFAQRFLAKNMIGQQPPELQVVDGHLINAETPPSLEQLRGQVVWIEFAFMN